MYYFYDWTMIFVLIGVAISGCASLYMRSTFSKYSRVNNLRGYTGESAARQVLSYAGIGHIPVESVAGDLTDHYDPRGKVLRLSSPVYSNTSVAAIGVAIHECGHALQDKENYGPLVLRSFLVPAANIGSQLSWPIFMAGLIFSFQPLLQIGIFLFLGAVVFQLITLPVEFNASFRAIRLIEEGNILSSQELKGVKRVLIAAALTYVAGFISILLQLLRLIILAGGRGRGQRD